MHAKFGDELWGAGGSTTAGQEDAAHPTSPPAPAAAEEPPAEEPTRPKAARAFQRHVAGRAWDAEAVWATLRGLLRDTRVRRHRDALAERFGAGDYYNLRSTTTAARGAAPDPDLRSTARGGAPAGKRAVGGLEVDHTMECQFLTHALVQTPEFHAALAQLDVAPRFTGLGAQPAVVRNLLKPVFDLNNSDSAHDYFNLRMVSPQCNKHKMNVVKTFIKADKDAEGRRGVGGGLRARLVHALSKDVGDEGEAERYASALQRELEANADEWVVRLHGGVGSSASEHARYEALAESIHTTWDGFSQRWCGA